MPLLQLSHVCLTFPGRSSPFSLAGLLPASCAGSPTPVLIDICLQANDGERLALLGPPGAGKSTLLQILAGRLSCTSGTCQVTGDLTAILDVERALDIEMTGWQNLERLAGVRAGWAAELSGLGELLEVPVHACSPGMRWRLGFAAATAWPSEVLLIDECLRYADLAFRPVVLHRLQQLLTRSSLAVVAEPALLELCGRWLELSQGQLHEREMGRIAA